VLAHGESSRALFRRVSGDEARRMFCRGVGLSVCVKRG
jgi:hypothetical protein